MKFFLIVAMLNGQIGAVSYPIDTKEECIDKAAALALSCGNRKCPKPIQSFKCGTFSKQLKLGDKWKDHPDLLMGYWEYK